MSVLVCGEQKNIPGNRKKHNVTILVILHEKDHYLLGL